MKHTAIEKAAYDYVYGPTVPAMSMQFAFGDFVNGAEWAIEKAKRFLKNNIVVKTHVDENGMPVGYELCADFSTQDELIEAFNTFIESDEN